MSKTAAPETTFSPQKICEKGKKYIYVCEAYQFILVRSNASDCSNSDFWLSLKWIYSILMTNSFILILEVYIMRFQAKSLRLRRG